ncbi:hypothetical protein GCM10010307_29350 [Streptomyces vastus]|uniref:Uncharacterized protein n=1 Tax=Streptomyces vastus TaxID=285451 RepID=A0ABN3QT53_9ACTN
MGPVEETRLLLPAANSRADLTPGRSTADGRTPAGPPANETHDKKKESKPDGQTEKTRMGVARCGSRHGPGSRSDHCPRRLHRG